MQSLRFSAALVAALTLAAPAAIAKEAPVWARATLVTPAEAPVTASADGVDWTCTGADCQGVVAKRAPDFALVRECKGVAAALGPLAAFETHGRTVTASQLEQCNKAAKAQ